MSVKIREKQKANGDIALYLDIYYKGKRQYEFLDLFISKNREKNKQVRRLAEDICSKRQLELSGNNYQITPHFKSKVNFIEYFETVAANGKHRNWTSTLHHLKDYAGNSVPFQSIDEKWLMGFQKHLLNVVDTNTAITYFNKIKAALNLAKKEKLIRENPAEFIENIREKPTEKIYLNLNEIKILNETPLSNESIKRAFLFSCFTGLRLSDVRRLEWKHVQGEQLTLRMKKTGQPEYLPLSQAALKFLGDRGQDTQKVFKMMNSDGAVWTTLQRWKEKAGIQKHISFHVSRHTFATLALTHGVDLYTVSKLLGHSSIKNTQIYAKIVDQKKKDAVNMLPEL